MPAEADVLIGEFGHLPPGIRSALVALEHVDRALLDDVVDRRIRRADGEGVAVERDAQAELLEGCGIERLHTLPLRPAAGGGIAQEDVNGAGRYAAVHGGKRCGADQDVAAPGDGVPEVVCVRAPARHDLRLY